jgi:hypothetical protein
MQKFLPRITPMDANRRMSAATAMGDDANPAITLATRQWHTQFCG